MDNVFEKIERHVRLEQMVSQLNKIIDQSGDLPEKATWFLEKARDHLATVVEYLD